jgi:hypothetical protein
VDGEWNMDGDDVMEMQWDNGQAFCFLLCLLYFSGLKFTIIT